jgi:hypothetical protein
MNDDSNRSQLNSLKAELERVETDLRFLRVKASELESRILAQEQVEQSQARSEVLARVVAPPPVIPNVPESLKPEPPPIPQPTPIATVQPASQSAPPIIRTVPASALSATITPQPSIPEPSRAVISEPALRAPKPPVEPAAPRESFEMRLGTYWFVRVGIVMVLTALVFLGNYAYQHYVGLLGPLGKVILMYAASGGLLAGGAILPRKHERLKNYGQVLFAGGLAAVYFTTYAAYHFPNLQVITSVVVDGALLLAWTSYIVWLADRKKIGNPGRFCNWTGLLHSVDHKRRQLHADLELAAGNCRGVFSGSQSLGDADVCEHRGELRKLFVLALLCGRERHRRIRGASFDFRILDDFHGCRFPEPSC